MPVVFEDRWVVYQRSGALYFVETWSGELALVASAAPGLTLTAVWAPPREGTDTRPPHAVRMVDFLVESHVLDRWCPHPVPPELGTDAEAIAQNAFVTWGRRGLFATSADTTAIQIDLPVWPADGG